MSRLGKKPIILPLGVEAEVVDNKVSVKGPKGSLSRQFRNEIGIALHDRTFEVVLKKETVLTKKLLGTYISLIKGMVEGAFEGFSKKLILEGIGYKAQLEGGDLNLSLGFSHQIKFPAEEGITFKVEKNLITISGADKEKVGQVAAKLRSLKKPDPYKGKGFRYDDEVIRRKAGKKAAGTA